LELAFTRPNLMIDARSSPPEAETQKNLLVWRHWISLSESAARNKKKKGNDREKNDS
jgi:hypothetical protein